MSIINTYKPIDRFVAGKTDYPFSLQCGIAGEICFLLDLFTPEGSYYPGYEI